MATCRAGSPLTGLSWNLPAVPDSYTGPPSTFDGTSSQTSSIAHEFKGELKAEISNFSNIFFAKSNINEVNFVKLFSLVYCFLRENYVRSWIFPAFATSSLWAQKLNQQPAVTYDMGKDGEERFRNQEKQGKHKWCTAIHHYG